MAGGPKQRSNLSLMADVVLLTLAALTALAVLAMWFARSDALGAIASGAPPRLMALDAASQAAGADQPSIRLQDVSQTLDDPADPLRHRLLLPGPQGPAANVADRPADLDERDGQAVIIDAATGRRLIAHALAPSPEASASPDLPPGAPERVRFGDRVMTPDRVMRMKVTAYSPDDKSCGIWADGVTASGYSVWTNAMKLVAADADLMPFGTVITIPGYNQGQPVPVLDRGGKIKGPRLDVLFPTHQEALAWGVQKLDVIVWKPASEESADDLE